MRTKLLKQDLGILSAEVWLYVGPHTEKSLMPIFKGLGYGKAFDDLQHPDWDKCYGICYSFRKGSLIWIHPENKLEQLYDTIPHEVSHAVDDIMDSYGYKCGELKAKLQGLLTKNFIKGLRLTVK